MKQLSKPLTTKQVVCHDGKNVYHFVEVTPDLVCTSGQPYMEVCTSKKTLATKVKSLKLTGKNLEDYENFKAENVQMLSEEVK